MRSRPIARGTATVLLLLLMAPSAGAQFPVTDPINIAQNAAIVLQKIGLLKQYTEQINLYIRLVQKLDTIVRYRMHPIDAATHVASLYPQAAPILEALNAGDPRGSKLGRIRRTLPYLKILARHIDGPSGSEIVRLIARLEMADSIMERTIHQIGASRAYDGGEIARAIAECTADVLNPRTSLHYPTARLDTIAACQTIARQQDRNGNQMLSALVETLIDEQIANREAQTAFLNAKVEAIESSNAIDVFSGFDHDWKQP